MMEFKPPSGLANYTTPNVHKRRIDDDEIDHFFKKRLLDNFDNLKIFEGSRSISPVVATDVTSKVPTPDLQAQKQKSASSDSVYIDSIDQFLKDNLDDSDLETRPINSTDEVITEKKGIVIAEGLLKPLNELFNQSSQNENEKFLNDKKRETIEKIMSRKRAQQREFFNGIDKQDLETDAMMDVGETFKEPEIEISNDEIYYETYIGQFWSLVKYYNPSMLVLRTAQKWYLLHQREIQSRFNSPERSARRTPVYKSDQIEELDNDGDNVLMDEILDYETPYHHDFRTSTPSPTRAGDFFTGPKFADMHDEEDEELIRDSNDSGFKNKFKSSLDTTSDYGSFYSQDPNDTAEFSTVMDSVVDNINNDDDDEMELDF